MTTALHEAVNANYRHGFAPLAIRPDGSKAPAVPTWEQWQQRRPTPDEVRRMFRSPDLNLALICGAVSGGLAVLDIDDQELAKAMSQDAGLRMETTMVRTPRDGLHVHVIETDATSRSGPLVPGVADLKAGGGYVLAPPSRIEGREYVTLTNSTIMCVPDARAWAIQTLRLFDVEIPEAQERQPVDVAAVLEGVPKGRRDEELFRLACKLRRADVPRKAAERIVLEAAGNCSPPFPQREALAKVSSAYDHYKPAPANESEPTLRADCLDALLEREDEPLDPVIGDGANGAILTRDGKGAVAGPTGVGKTNLGMRLSRCLCTAEPFLGLPIPKARTVLYLLLEGSPRATKRRLRKIWDGAPPKARERFHVGHVTMDLGNEDNVAALHALIGDLRPDVLIIDPLRNAHPGDENDSAAMARLTAILDGIIQRHRCAIVVMHHDRKRPPFVRRDAGTDRLRGSTAFTGWLSFALSIDADPSGEDRIVAEWVKTRDAEAPLERMALDFDRETIDFIPSERAPEGKVSDEAIITAVSSGGGSARGVDLVRGFVEGAGASDRWVRERLRALVKDGRLLEYVAEADRKTGAKSYRLAEETGE